MVRLQLSGTIPCRLTRPYVGFSPTTPQNAAGIRVEPPVSLPVASGMRRAARAPAEPALEPPVVTFRFQGFLASPKTSMLPAANSVVLSLPRQMAPASRKRATTVASSFATKPRIVRDPAAVGSPRTWKMSLCATGMPCSAPR
jgi:hypothetical protein